MRLCSLGAIFHLLGASAWLHAAGHSILQVMPSGCDSICVISPDESGSSRSEPEGAMRECNARVRKREAGLVMKIRMLGHSGERGGDTLKDLVDEDNMAPSSFSVLAIHPV